MFDNTNETGQEKVLKANQKSTRKQILKRSNRKKEEKSSLTGNERRGKNSKFEEAQEVS